MAGWALEVEIVPGGAAAAVGGFDFDHSGKAGRGEDRYRIAGEGDDARGAAVEQDRPAAEIGRVGRRGGPGGGVFDSADREGEEGAGGEPCRR